MKWNNLSAPLESTLIVFFRRKSHLWLNRHTIRLSRVRGRGLHLKLDLSEMCHFKEPKRTKKKTPDNTHMFLKDWRETKSGLPGDIQPNCDRVRFRLEKIYAIILSVNSVCAGLWTRRYFWTTAKKSDINAGTLTRIMTNSWRLDCFKWKKEERLCALLKPK